MAISGPSSREGRWSPKRPHYTPKVWQSCGRHRIAHPMLVRPVGSARAWRDLETSRLPFHVACHGPKSGRRPDVRGNRASRRAMPQERAGRPLAVPPMANSRNTMEDGGPGKRDELPLTCSIPEAAAPEAVEPFIALACLCAVQTRPFVSQRNADSLKWPNRERGVGR